MSGQLHALTALPLERAPGTHWIGGWVSHRASLDDVEKRKFLSLPRLELQPVASRYPDSVPCGNKYESDLYSKM
jgi:hypothetical protein